MVKAGLAEVYHGSEYGSYKSKLVEAEREARKDRRGMYNQMIENINKRGFYIFCAVLLIYCIFFTGLAIWRYEHFLFKESDDLLLFEQVIYNTLNGRPFYNNFSEQNHFGDHNSPMLAVLVPFAAIFPVPHVLYAFTVFSVAISAIPIYLLAKYNLENELLAILLGTCYIMLPTFVGQLFQAFHEINLVLPFLSFAFYYFVKERFTPFVVMFIMGLMVKEDVSLTFLMFSVYALIKRRERKWYLVPAILSLGWLFLSIKIIIPFFNKEHRYGMISYLGNMGGTVNEVVITVFTHPLRIFKESFQLKKLFYLFILLFPVGVILPFFAAEIIFAIPSVFLNMISESTRGRPVFFSTPDGDIALFRHMFLMPSVFLFIATIYAIKRISSFYPKYSTIIATTLSLLLMSAITYNDRFLLFRYFYRTTASSIGSIKKILSLIPRDATVQAERGIATHLYDRKVFEKTEEPDYIVFTAENVSSKIIEEYDLIALEKGICLFRKKQISY